jgi:pimeloyl-ACP methyl ester carboxylesterase
VSIAGDTREGRVGSATSDHAQSERVVGVGGAIELCCRVDGDPADPVMLLIAGLGQQLNVWPAIFVELLVARGYRVVRFDNRDVGRSSRSLAPAPTRRQLLTGRFAGAQYTIADMAADAAGLLDGLEVRCAHVVGVSLGGMVGQTLAARSPERVLTLTSVMSTTGAWQVGRPALSTYARLLPRPPRTRAAAADRLVAVMRHIRSRGFPFDEPQVRAVALEAWDRGGGTNAAGILRQIAAIYKSGDRSRELQRITAPTLVIHGDRDRMVHPSGGRATAAAIPGSRHQTIAGMGHDLPDRACAQVVEAIDRHVRQVGAPG